MKYRLASLFIVYLLFFVILDFSSTSAFFTDSATSQANTFSTATEFPEEPPATPSGILISEISAAGNSSVDWVEVYNPTASPINISGWDIVDNSSFDTIPTTASIPIGGFAVIVASGSGVTVPLTVQRIELLTLTIGNGLAEAGDRVSLRDLSDNTIDSTSYGTDTSIFTLPGIALGQSLSRIPNSSDTNSASDWQIDSSPTIGTINTL